MSGEIKRSLVLKDEELPGGLLRDINTTPGGTMGAISAIDEAFFQV